MWIISTCELRDQCLNCTQQQFKFKICIQLWVYSLSDPFKLQTTLLLLLLSLFQNLQCTTHQQCDILSGSKQMVPEASQSLVACICIVMTLSWTPQSLGVGAFSIWGLQCCCFLDQLCCCCCCVYYTSFFGIWTSPSICTLNSCRDVQRSDKHNFWYYSLQAQNGQSWYRKFLNSSHSQYLLNLFC